MRRNSTASPRTPLRSSRSLRSLPTDAELGVIWWNRSTEPERAYWLMRAGSATPADAWETFRRETARELRP
jgi:hypothetical protein